MHQMSVSSIVMTSIRATMASHTLCVHEIGNGNRVVALDVGDHALENSIDMRFTRAHPHVFLAEMLELGVDGNRLLEAIRSASCFAHT